MITELEELAIVEAQTISNCVYEPVFHTTRADIFWAFLFPFAEHHVATPLKDVGLQVPTVHFTLRRLSSHHTLVPEALKQRDKEKPNVKRSTSGLGL